MSKLLVILERLDEQLAHEVAHMPAINQIEAYLWMARRCAETAEEIARAELSEE